jgi:predicted RNA-binding protein
MHDASTIRAMIREVDDGRLVLAPSGNSYELSLVPTGAIGAEAGQRISGRIEAEALKIHPAEGGGIFIEPIMGQPRIVAGRVIEVDAEQRRVVIDSVVPMTLSLASDDDLQYCLEGRFINCHVRSGATFTPST